jgi:hypothetical protein
MDLQVHEPFRISNTHDQKRTPLHHVIIEISRVQNKERILKVAREL